MNERCNIFGGQARREKISERMRILQDLVPGCNKVWCLVSFHCVSVIAVISITGWDGVLFIVFNLHGCFLPLMGHIIDVSSSSLIF